MYQTSHFPGDAYTFRMIFEASPFPVYLCMGEDLLVTIANKATLDIWGKTKEVIGKPFHEILPELEDQPFRQLLLEVYRTGNSCSFTDQRADILINGVLQTFYFTFSYQPFKDPTGRVTGVFCIANDVTGLKKADEQQALLSAIISSSNDAIISKNLDGIIESWNDAATRMFGYTQKEMIGESIYKLIPFGKRGEEQQILVRLQQGERVEHFETKRETKDKKELDVSITVSPIKDNQGKIIGLSKIARDISEQKHAERRKNDFITIASHELKTPLTTIKSYVQMLLAKAHQADKIFDIAALSRVERQTEKMSILIQNFINNAKLADGTLELEFERFNVDILLKEVARNAEILFQTHVIKMVDCEEVFVFADRKKIALVFENMISNAVKYSAIGSQITITCKTDQENVRLAVSDNGIGISNDDQLRMFDRYYRVKDEKHKNTSGFGIGLYLVAQILERHSSTINVDSKVNKGSRFYFDLPIAGPLAVA